MNILLARQPIFDASDEVVGYALLCRETHREQDSATAEGADRVLVDAITGVGLAKLAKGKTAFISVTRELLLGDSLALLDPADVVIQLLPTIEVDQEVVQACERLVGAGYRVALDDFTFDESKRRLLELAAVVKIDVARHSGPDLISQVDSIKPFNVRLLAENVENRGVHYVCLHLGFELFQGYHFSREETVSKQDVSVEHLRTFRLMKVVRDFDSPDQALEDEFRTDVGLTYKLLRIVNSALHGGHGIRSIGHAIRMLGREQIYRWLSLLLIPAPEEGGIDAEKANATLVRARFCELLADSGRRPLAPGSLFMIGLLSGLENCYGLALDDVTQELELAPEVQSALTSRGGQLGATLALVTAYEDARWDDVADRCEELGVPQDDLTVIYLAALSWASKHSLLEDADQEQASA